ncbi:unnamed protein product [Orchesella dallaii]|uniref:Programmed cell death protein 10 dimerisation domain-containing protein n=1 Tax=Orchesella dallaii TaxID=48710 RepID=A0ABP1RG67_9HEXA
MTMGENTPLVPLVNPLLLRPVLTQMSKSDPAAPGVRNALAAAEASCPGISLELTLAIIKKSELNVGLNEAILRLQGTPDDNEASEYRTSRSEEPFRELSKKSAQLKRILSRIPDEIIDRKTFLETIKEIASTIKKVLDAVAAVSALVPNPNARALLEQRKREFVKYSKRFSTTLKEYFRDGLENPVYLSALYLINQTNLIMMTVKDRCE